MPISFVGTGSPLTAAGIGNAGDSLSVAAPEIWTVLQVETTGCGYLADRRPKILFERHYFSRLTGGIYDAEYPDISNQSAGGYGAGGSHQYDRLSQAMMLDEQAALMSASWGVGQVMGENCTRIGYPDVVSMVEAMVASEDNQMSAVAGFILSNDIASALANHDWAAFAQVYNGGSYKKNNYDVKLKNAYTQLSAGPLPDITVRTVQILLMYLGYDPGAKDGIVGNRTRNALSRFQADNGLPVSNVIDEGTVATLRAALQGS
jgi:N-acetylmuramidase/Putative peptidoglycan binding domain